MNPSSSFTVSLEKPAFSISQFVQETCELSELLIDRVLFYLCYCIAILCILKCMMYMVNGITANPQMGARIMDDTSFFR
uniref:Uncharacterized protein n=1 Tax=viral metagenome TaxID=1070528 RepID=A0A6C0KL00_9ZZZZ